MSSDTEDPQSAPSDTPPAPRGPLRVCYVYRTDAFKTRIDNHKSFRNEENWVFHWVRVTEYLDWKRVAQRIKRALGGRGNAIVGRVLDCFPLLDYLREKSATEPPGNQYDEALAALNANTPNVIAVTTPTVIVVEEEACFGGKGDRLWWVRRMMNRRLAWMVIVASVGRNREGIRRVRAADDIIPAKFDAKDVWQTVENVRRRFRRSCWARIWRVGVAIGLLFFGLVIRPYVTTWSAEKAKQPATHGQTERTQTGPKPTQVQPPQQPRADVKEQTGGTSPEVIAPDPPKQPPADAPAETERGLQEFEIPQDAAKEGT